MQLIDEQDNPALGLLHLVQHGLQPFLKFAPVLGACHQRAHIQGEHGLILQRGGNLLLDDPLCQPLHNGGLTHAGFADEHRVVLRLPGQNADDVPDFLVTADHRIHLLLSCPLDQVSAVLFQRVVGSLRVVGGDTLIAPDFLQSLQNTLLCNLIGLEQLLHAAPGSFQKSKEQMLHRHILVLHGLRLLLRRIERGLHVGADIKAVHGLTCPHAGDLSQLGLRRRFQTFHRNVHLFQQLRGQTALLPQQCQKQMHLLHLLMRILNRQLLRALDSLNRFLGIVIEVHLLYLPFALALSLQER